MCPLRTKTHGLKLEAPKVKWGKFSERLLSQKIYYIHRITYLIFSISLFQTSPKCWLILNYYCTVWILLPYLIWLVYSYTEMSVQFLKGLNITADQKKTFRKGFYAFYDAATELLRSEHAVRLFLCELWILVCSLFCVLGIALMVGYP